MHWIEWHAGFLLLNTQFVYFFLLGILESAFASITTTLRLWIMLHSYCNCCTTNVISTSTLRLRYSHLTIAIPVIITLVLGHNAYINRSTSFIKYSTWEKRNVTVNNNVFPTWFATTSTLHSRRARWIGIGLQWAPFGVVNAIQFVTAGHNFWSTIVGWFLTHS